ncbi:Vacuolar protein sorting-associated protein 13C [Chionoecetes opilio]|uniref:Vacuolar protein sorting-associated protein 13C n=1 Tax=Chionoecetes opilio TaxID=41210 RepID=A0A8J4YGP0_CHIOP|nr:Vacuolar protein sorting-associated protein 13C [Chionoecetes opilio]
MEWLTKKVVAGLVNRLFGQYLEDLDTQEVNNALLSGQVNLSNLKIRRDALSFLDVSHGSPLPIEVKNGTIGRISLTVPYSSFFTQPVVLNIEDVFVLVTPVVEYDSEREKDLERARKRQTLAYLFPDPTLVDAVQEKNSLWGMLYNRIWNNLELHINNVHIRYEDTHTCHEPLVIGLCLQSLSADTTNHKWKKTQIDGNSTTVNKVVDFISTSLYVNPESDRQRLVKPHITTDRWRQYLQQGLQTFSINDEPFQFVLQPVRCKVKMRQQMKREARVPGLLVDAVIKDAALSLSQQQYLSLTELFEAFSIINTSRSLYKEYTQLYRKHLLEGHNSELEADLMKLEDALNLTNIVLARMHAKIKRGRGSSSSIMKQAEINTKGNEISAGDLIALEPSGGGWFSWLMGASESHRAEDAGTVDIVGTRRRIGPFTALTEEERRQLHTALLELNAPGEDVHKDDIDLKAYLSLQNVSLTLRDDEHDVALATLSGFVMSAENRHGVKYHKLSVKAESFNLEASNMEQELVYVVKLVDGTPSASFGIAFSLDLEQNPLNAASDYAVIMKLDPLELLYNQHACAEMIYFFRVPNVEYRTFDEVAADTLAGVVSSGRAAMEYAIARHKTISLDLDIKSPFIVLPEHGSIQKGGNVLVLDMGGLKVNSEIGGQILDVEDATRMELEERLYDRLTVTISQLQILFADSGDEWRVHRTRNDSDSHLLPRVRVKLDLANSIHPEYRQLPQQKVDIHITPLKLNLSDSRLGHLVEFTHHLPTLNCCILNCDTIDNCSFQQHQSSDHGDRPYLMLRATHMVLESAVMDYGPALQLTLGSLQLVDKYHHSPSGEYLELVSSPQVGCTCIATMLYRKVRANCPDFKTHFHSCEHSLVLDFATLNVVWHRGIIEIEEDRVFDIKYVNFSPTHKGVDEIDMSQNPVNPEAALRIRVGRVQCVFLCKFLADLQRFMEPLINREGTQVVLKHAGKAAEAGFEEVLSGKKLSLSIDIHAPTILIPQKSDSSSLLVISLGELKVDNLFKTAYTGAGGGAVENILLELGHMHVCRAVMVLSGGLEMQEDILEPCTIKADIKRSLIPQCRDLLSWDLSIHMGTLCVNMGQRDLNTILAVMTQNTAEAQFIDTSINSQPLTPIELGTPQAGCDDSMGKLQAFLTHSVDIYRIADALLSLDGLTLTLYTDMDEVLSSPVRDAATALCRLEVGEVEVHGDMNSDRSMDVRVTLHSCDLFDVRPDIDYHIIKKIFGQYSKEMHMSSRRFSVSVPPIMDLMYKMSPNGDGAMEVSIERTRLNMSVTFVLALYKYVNEAIPGSASTSGGILNPGFVGDLGTTVDGVRIIRRPPSSADSTSGYLSTVTSNTDDQKTLSLSFKVKRPEIVLFIDPEEQLSRILVLRCEVHVDYSRHPGNESFHVALDRCQLFASMYSVTSQSPYSIMQPCDIEGSWVFRNVEEGARAELRVPQVHLHLNPAVVHLFMDVVDELTLSLNLHLTPFKLHLPNAYFEDLWSPKPLTATISPTNPDEEVYIKPEYPSTKPHQCLSIRISELSVSLEKQTMKTAIPVLLCKSALSAEINDWSKLMYCKAEIQLQLSCFNEQFSAWEPVIEPVSESNKVLRPWEAIIRTLQSHAQPVGMKRKHPGPYCDSVDTSYTSNRNSYLNCPIEDSESSTDEEYQDNEMVVLKPHATQAAKRSNTRRPTADIGSLSGFPLDSDSETEDSVLHKISNAFTHMFSSDSEGSEEGDSSDEMEGKESIKKDVDGSEKLSTADLESSSSEKEDGPVFTSPLIPDGADGTGNWMEDTNPSELATYVFVNSRDNLEFTLTSHTMTAISSLVDGATKVEVLATAKYQEPDSLPSSPASGKSHGDGDSPSEDESVIEGFRDWDHISLHSYPASSPDAPPSSLPSSECFYELFCPNPVKLYQDITKLQLLIKVPGFNDLVVFVGTRSRSRIFQLSPPRNDKRYHVIVTVQVEHLTTNVTVRSPLQIMNEIPLPVNVCFKKSIVEMLGHSLGELSSRVVSPVNPFDAHVPMVTLQPDQVFTVPLAVAYHSSLHIQPAAADYDISDVGVWWKDVLSSTCSYLLTCKGKTEHNPDIAAAVTIQEGVKLSSLQWEGLSGVLPNYTLCLSPPLAIHNMLPCTLTLAHPSFAQPLILDPGAKTSLYKIDLDKKISLEVQVSNYLGGDWNGILEIGTEKGDDHRTLTLTHGDGSARRKLECALYTVRAGLTAVHVYSPYWIVNKTGLSLHVRGSRSKIVYDLSGSEDIVLFRYKRSYPHKLKVRVMDSDWSRRWGCEAVGSCGVVVCRDSVRDKKYRILARVKHSTLAAQTLNEGVQGGCLNNACSSKLFPQRRRPGKLHLTKIVTLMPYFLIRNLTIRPLKFMQENDKVELWYDIHPQQCMPFWPDGENMHMVVRYRDQQVRSQHFHFNSNHNTILRMEKGRAMNVCVSGVGSDSPVTITFDKYQAGDAPVRIENWCEDVHLRIHQKGSNQVHLLAPHQSQLYTWDDPILPRELLWNIYNRKNEDLSAVIDKDGAHQITIQCGTPKTRPKKLGQRQRAKTTAASSSDSEEETEPIVEKTHGQYLVPDQKFQATKMRRDKMLVHWVSYKQGSQRILLFTQSDRLAATTRLPMERARLELCLALEKIGLSLINEGHREVAYLSLMAGAAKWEIEVDGVWKVPPSLELIAWLEDQYLNNKQSKVNLRGSLQIRKNTVELEVDLTTMYMTKPFSGKLRRTKYPALWLHYRHSHHYCYISAHLHRLQIDNQLMDAVFPTVFYPTNENGSPQPCLSVCALLHFSVGGVTTVKHLSIVAQEFFLKLDKGFLLSTYEVLEPFIPGLHSGSIHTELKKLRTSVTFSAMKHQHTSDEGPQVERVCVAGLKVRFSFSPRGTVLGSHGGQNDMLEWILTSLGATLTEVYVLVLGLDILGNPYQRLRDLSQGVKDLIYQPALGIIDGPDEFAEGVARGAQSLMGHVVGGTADSLNLISSAVGNTIAMLSFDQEYRKRREQRLELQSSFPRTLLYAGRTFVMGVVLGLSGVVVKPVAGAQQDGVEGFFRGVGRGIMGLITKPALGVIDSVAMACDAVRRAVDLGHEVITRSRVPRHVSPYIALHPYSIHEAAGMALLASLCHGHYMQTDFYIAHATLSEANRPDVILISDKHIFKLERCGMWGNWDISWRVAVRNLLHQPTVKDDTILLVLRQDESHSQLSGSEHQIRSEDSDVLLYLVRWIEVLTTLSMVDQPCPRIQ